MKIPTLGGEIDRVKRTVARFWFPVRRRENVEVLGSDYGGWAVPVELINSNSICYCVGVGEDASFDLALIQRFDCHVHAFDPTPRSVEFVRKNASAEPRFHFHPYGIWKADEVCRFYAPQKKEHVSHSIANLRGTKEYFDAPCRAIGSVMRELGHDHIDLLKLDIEGAEYEVIQSMIEANIFPRVLCVEFDQPYPFRKTAAFVKWMLQFYELFMVDRWNFHFLHREIVLERSAAVTA